MKNRLTTIKDIEDYCLASSPLVESAWVTSSDEQSIIVSVTLKEYFGFSQNILIKELSTRLYDELKANLPVGTKLLGVWVISL